MKFDKWWLGDKLCLCHYAQKEYAINRWDKSAIKVVNELIEVFTNEVASLSPEREV